VHDYGLRRPKRATALARAETAPANAKFKADGYQIRDLQKAGRIVFLEHFNL
jgi:hypothetical protein